MKVVSHLNTGAYGSYGIPVSQLHTETLTGPYRIPNVRLDTYLVYTNSPIGGAMRGFGAPQSNFGSEGMMDILAKKLGMDPLAFRQKNIWRSGDRNVTRALVNQPESLEKSAEIVEQEINRLKQIPPSPGMKSGVGLPYPSRQWAWDTASPMTAPTGWNGSRTGKSSCGLARRILGRG